MSESWGQKGEWWLPGPGGRDTEVLFTADRVSAEEMKWFWKWMVGMVEHQWEYTSCHRIIYS